MIEVRVEPGDTLNWMQRLSDQAPFAVSVGLNRTAEDGLAALRGAMRSGFILRDERFDLPPQQVPAAFRATKDKLYTEVRLGYSDGPSSIGGRRERIFAKFEEGKPKTADPSYPIAIPTKALRPEITALVPRKLYPRNLVGRFNVLGEFQGLARTANVKNVFRKTAGGTNVYRRQVGRYFVLGGPGDRYWGVYERTGSGEDDIRRLWTLKTRIPIPLRSVVYEPAQRAIEARWIENMEGAWDLAVRTAK